MAETVAQRLAFIRRHACLRVAMAGLACGAVLITSPQSFAAPIVMGFESISNNSVASTDIAEAQMSVEVSDAGSNTVLFKFFNTGPDAATISEIYFDDDVPVLDSANFDASTDISDSLEPGDPGGIQFEEGASPGNLPGGNAIAFSATFASSADSPAPQNGVNPGEWVSFLFSFVGGQSFATLADAINSGEFRLGIHVIAFDNQQSESLVNTPPGNPIPEPTSMLLMALGAVGMGGLARRRSRAKQESPAA